LLRLSGLFLRCLQFDSRSAWLSRRYPYWHRVADYIWAQYPSQACQSDVVLKIVADLAGCLVEGVQLRMGSLCLSVVPTRGQGQALYFHSTLESLLTYQSG